MPGKFVEEVQLHGHILDSLLLPKVLDTILSHGGNYHIKDLRLGNRQSDPSRALLEVRADSAEKLEEILSIIHDHGAIPTHDTDCQIKAADIAGTFPDGFYCTTNYRTQVRLQGEWVEVEDMEMDCGILIDPEGAAARCIPMTNVQVGDGIAVGLRGIRVFPPESQQRTDLFEFMSSPVSSEKPKGVTVREIAAAMRRSRQSGEKILAVLGPAVVHTGGSLWVSWLIQAGYINVLFAGNALATHDMEQAFYGTSLGVSLERGIPAAEGHEHHLRTINTIRRVGGIRKAVETGLLKTGIMFECIKANIPYVLAGSIRDDGPLPDVITDMIQAQAEMRKQIPGVGFCLMAGTTLHSIATGNMLPGWVKVACVDINPATVTKLMDRGSTQTIGIVSDVEPFFRSLVMELGKE
ncbi:TIGR00300 family protein [Telmatocola sphagniphila]|uniref:ornithine cyclodeaminase n=1 Tax=Telmatocola sphagniphila TaxID=1123043 RepID=A0A8E6F0D5_9BACT|nr:TIGR00300 family protein [Telmatocola sphagniphila]QVL34688.1 TIGR00300 family protein [Telmatocola sphagniphila]